MSSDDEKVDEIELKAAEKKDATEDEKLRVNEAQMRYEVAREIEDTPIFKALKKSTQDANIGLMLDVIVDRYFDNGGSPIDPTLFKVDAGLVQMALRQTIYLISVSENGVVLDETGNIDEEKSLEQQEGMTRVAIADLPEAETKAIFEKALDEGEKNNYQTEKESADVLLDKFFHDFEHYSMEEILEYAKSDKGQKEKAESLKESKKNSEKGRDDSHFEKKDDVFAMDICGKIVELVAVPTSQYGEDTKKQLAQLLVELNKYKKTSARDLFKKDGKPDLRKIIKTYQDYEEAYQRKENFAVFDKFKGQKYAELSAEEKKEYLEAAYALYYQDGGKGKKEAMRALAEIDGVLEKGKFSMRLNPKGFASEYNAVTDKNYEMKPMEVKSIIFKNQRGLAKDNIKFLLGMIKDGTFVEQNSEERRIAREKEQAEKKHKPEEKYSGETETKTLRQDLLHNINDPTAVYHIVKQSLASKVMGRLHKNYTRGKISKIEGKMNKRYSKLSDEQVFSEELDLKTLVQEQQYLMKERKLELEEQRKLKTGEQIEIFDDNFTKGKSKKRESERSKAIKKIELTHEEIERSKQIARKMVRPEQKNLAIAKAYYVSLKADEQKAEKERENLQKQGIKPSNTERKESSATILLREYMLEHSTEFGRFIDSNENGSIISISNIYKATQNKSLEHLSDENIQSIIQDFNDVKMHKMTPELILRGSFSAAKDALGVIQRRVLSFASFGVKKLGVGSAKLTIGENRIEELQDYIDNGDKIQEKKTNTRLRNLLGRHPNREEAMKRTSMGLDDLTTRIHDNSEKQANFNANAAEMPTDDKYGKFALGDGRQLFDKSIQVDVAPIQTKQQKDESAKVDKIKEACIEAISKMGVQVNGIEKCSAKALIDFIAANGGMQMVQDLKEEYGMEDEQMLEETATSKTGENRDDDAFTL